MNKDEAYEIAENFGVDVNENTVDKILKAKERMGLGIRCPCEPNNTERYCGSDYCMNEVKENKHCHCNLFIRK